jgi:hypothetical protein
VPTGERNQYKHYCCGRFYDQHAPRVRAFGKNHNASFIAWLPPHFV